MYYLIVVCLGVGVLITYWIYDFVKWIWLTPRKLEKCLREQGFSGNKYRILQGDQRESAAMIREAMSKPISLTDDIKDRAFPHIIHTIRKHGVKSFMWVGRIPRIHVTDPELVKQVLTNYNKFHKNLHNLDPITQHLFCGVGFLEGDRWAPRRRIVSSAFHFDKLKLMLPAFYISCSNLANKWDTILSSKGGKAEIEVYRDFQSLTGDASSRTLFGSSFEQGKHIFQLINELTVLTIQVTQAVYIPGWRFMPTKRNRRIKSIGKDIRCSIRKIIDNKMKAMNDGESKSSDFLGILLETNMNEEAEQTKSNSVKLSMDDIIDECKLFYFAGQDSTSGLLTWTMVLLSRFPEWQQRAREEVLQVFGNKIPDYDTLNCLKIVTMILYETLRLYPLNLELTKVVHEETKLGEVTLPVGVQVMMPTVIIHHSREIWGDDVDDFKPERFAQGVGNATKSQGAFIPFSVGPRMCVGKNFVLLEAKMAMALILSRFSFELSPSYVHAPFTLISLQPQFGAHLILHKL